MESSIWNEGSFYASVEGHIEGNKEGNRGEKREEESGTPKYVEGVDSNFEGATRVT